MSKPIEVTFKPKEIRGMGFEYDKDEYAEFIEKTPHVSKCIALHDEMLAVLKATLESLLPYDKEGRMSAVVLAVCDVIKKAEGI